MIYIETPRLLLRDWNKDDIQLFAQMNSDPNVMKYFFKPLSEAESFALYRKIQNELNSCGFGLYALQKKDDGSFIGFTGFHIFLLDTDFSPGVEIGWRIRTNEWNKGFATEAATACLQYAKENLPFKNIWSFTSVLNKKSERVMQKIGLTKAKEFLHPLIPDNHPLKEHYLYQIQL